MKRTRIPGTIAKQTTGQSARVAITDWVPINVTDGSWASDDPNSVVASVSASSAGMRFQNNAAAFDHHMDANEDGGAAYYKLLKTADGQPMMFSDPGWSLEVLIKRQTLGNDNGCINIAVSDDPSDRTNRNWLGATYSNKTDGKGKWFVGTASGVNSGLHANSDRFLFHIFNPMDTSSDDDGNEITHAITYAHIDANLAAIHHGAKTNINQEYDQGDLVYLMVSSAFDNASTSQPGNNTDNTWKAWYRLSWSPQSIDPEYRIAGRGLTHQ